jgi:hypothetical protein
MENYNKSIGSLDTHVIPDIQKIKDYGISEAETLDTEMNTYELTSRESRFFESEE